MEDQILTLIIEARNEANAAFAQVHADLARMGTGLTEHAQAAGAAYSQTAAAAASAATAHAKHAEESVGAFGKLKEGIVDVGKVAAGFVAGQLIATGAMSIAEHVQEAADEVVTFGKQVIQMQRIIGGSAEDASSFTAVFDRMGISTDQAGVRLAFFSKNLVNHVEDIEGGKEAHAAFSKTMQDLGVATTNSDGSFRNSRDTLLDTFEAISKLPTAIERTAAATSVFGRGGVSLMPVIMRGREGFEEIAHGSATAGNVMNEGQLDSVKQFVEAQRDMGEATRGASTQLGLLFLPTATAAASAMAGIAVAINRDLVPALHAIPNAISSAVHAAGDLVSHFQLAAAGVAAVLSVSLAPALFGAAVAFGTAAVAAGAAAIAMVAPFVPVIVAVAAVIAVGVLLQKAWEDNALGIRTALQPVADWFASHVPLIVGALTVLVKAILWVPMSTYLLYRAWTEDWGGIQETVGAAVGWIRDRLDELLAAVQGPLEAIGSTFAQVWDGTQQIVGAAIEFMGSKIAGLMDFLAEHGMLGVQKSWRQDWANMVDDAGKGVTGIGNAVIDGASKTATDLAKAAQGAADTAGSILHPSGLTGIEPTPGDSAESSGGDTAAAPFGLSKKQLEELGTSGLGELTDLARMKEATAGVQDDLKAAEASLADLRATGADRQLEFEQSQLSNQMQLIDLKREGLAIDNQMQLPQEHLRDLALDLKQAAQDQVRLADEMRLLQLDAADFNQNADLKRIANQISQDQEQLDFTRSPAQAAALAADIERLKVQAHDIKVGMFGSQDARVEAEITASGDQLDVKLAQNPINQQIAAENAALDPIIRQKNAIADVTKSLQDQVDMAKMSYDQQVLAAQPAILAAQRHQQEIQATIRAQQAAYEQAVTQFVTQTAAAGDLSPKEVRAILKQVGLTDSAADKAAAVTEQLEEIQHKADDKAAAAAARAAAGPNSFTGGGGHTINVTINNPVLASDQHVQQVAAQVLAAIDHGQREAAAAGTPLPVWTGNPY